MSATTGRTRLTGPFVSEKSEWPRGVYLIQPDDPVLGGEDGPDNWPLISLVYRTVYLLAQMEAVLAAAGLTLDTASTNQLRDAIAKLIAEAKAAAATETVAGLVELATIVEAKAGTDATRAITPAGLAASLATIPRPGAATETVAGLVELATIAEAKAGSDTVRAITPAGLNAAIDALVNAAPGTLDTLAELAAALGNDANFAATITNALAAKAPLASPALTGTPTAPTAAAGTSSTQLATTAFVQTALVALGLDAYARLNAAQAWTKPQSCKMVTLTDAASIAWDLSAGQMFEVRLTASRTLAAPTNMPTSEFVTLFRLRVIHNAANTTLSFASAYTNVSALTLSSTAGAIDLLTFECDGVAMRLAAVAKNVGAA